MRIHCIIKVLRIYMTKLFSLAYPEGGRARIYDFLNVQTAKIPHALLAIHYKHNNFIRQRAKMLKMTCTSTVITLCFFLPPPSH